MSRLGRPRLRSMSIRVLALAVVVLLVGAVGALALDRSADSSSAPVTDAAPTTTTTQAPDRVLVIGDSNLEWSNAIVTAAFNNSGLVVTTHGKAGYGLKDFDGYWAPLLPGLLEMSDPDVVIVALGTNDAKPENVAAFASRLDQMMQALAGYRVIWVTHTEARPEPFGENQKLVNATIRAATGRYSNLSVLDLSPLEVQNPGLFGDDHVHFNETGQQAFGYELVQAAQQVVSAPVNVPVPITIPVTVPSVSIPTVP